MHQRIKTIIDGILKTKKISNAYLFVGAPKSGKLEAALEFAKKATNITKENHPDLLIIEKDKTTLKIDQIRKLKEIVRYGPNQAPYLFAIIKDAETLTIEAANSFLKCLEEPPQNTIFILLSNNESAIPLTIRSRCQKIIFPDKELTDIHEEAKIIYDYIVKSKDSYQLFEISKKMDLNSELLNSLTVAFYQNKEPKNLESVRVIQEVSQGIKRKGNKKLAADIMMLRLKDIWNKN